MAATSPGSVSSVKEPVIAYAHNGGDGWGIPLINIGGQRYNPSIPCGILCCCEVGSYNSCLGACDDVKYRSGEGDGRTCDQVPFKMDDPDWAAGSQTNVRGQLEHRLRSIDLQQVRHSVPRYDCCQRPWWEVANEINKKWCPVVNQEVLHPAGYSCHAHYWNTTQRVKNSNGAIQDNTIDHIVIRIFKGVIGTNAMEGNLHMGSIRAWMNLGANVGAHGVDASSSPKRNLGDHRSRNRQRECTGSVDRQRV